MTKGMFIWRISMWIPKPKSASFLHRNLCHSLYGAGNSAQISCRISDTSDILHGFCIQNPGGKQDTDLAHWTGLIGIPMCGEIRHTGDFSIWKNLPCEHYHVCRSDMHHFPQLIKWNNTFYDNIFPHYVCKVPKSAAGMGANEETEIHMAAILFFYDPDYKEKGGISNK